MALETGQYPDDTRPGLSDFQWVQYQLDCSATVEELLATDQRIRIQRDASPMPLHFLVSDRTGRSAAVEFIGGQLVCHTDRSLPVAALANHTYEASLA
jgi:choloylglycine hydrolase